NILRRNEMQRAAHRPRSQDAPLDDRLLDPGLAHAAQTKSNRPERGIVVLRLYGAERPHHCSGIFETRSIDVLIAQAASRDIHATQLARDSWRFTAPLMVSGSLESGCLDVTRVASVRPDARIHWQSAGRAPPVGPSAGPPGKYRRRSR